MIRGAPVPVADLVHAGRARELRGIGPGIEARLRELVETGGIAELEELERELSPGLIGLGRYLGLSAQRSVDIARALGGAAPRGVPRGGGGRPAARRAGRGGEDRGADPGGAVARPGAARALLLPHARELTEGIAAALGGVAAGDPRRWRDACERLAVVVRRRTAARALPRAAADRGDGRAGAGRRRDGRGRAGRARGRGARALRDRAGARDGVGRLRRGARAAPRRSRRGGGLRRARGSRGSRRSCARRRYAGEPPRLVELDDIRGDLHCHTTWSDGRFSVEEMGRAAHRARLRLHRDLRPHAGGRRRPGADSRRRPPPGRGDRRRQRGAGAVPRPARDRVRHPSRRAARPARRRARRARLGAGQRPRRPADAARGR